MTAAHDTLRQAIAEALHDGRGSASTGYRMTRWTDVDSAADVVLAAVLADPEVCRAFAITHAVDNEPECDEARWGWVVADTHAAIFANLRARHAHHKAPRSHATVSGRYRPVPGHTERPTMSDDEELIFPCKTSNPLGAGTFKIHIAALQRIGRAASAPAVKRRWKRTFRKLG